MRGHTDDCLDAAEAYLPCICGYDDYKKKVELMTQDISTLSPYNLRALILSSAASIENNDGRLSADSSADLDLALENFDAALAEHARRASIIEMVKDWTLTFGHPMAELPTPADVKTRAFRAELIREEFQEFIEAARVRHVDGTHWLQNDWDEPDFIEMADGLTDLLWVTIGAMLTFGMPIHDLMAEVFRSNMSKLGADGKPIYRKSDNKILKGPDYFKPDIAAVIAAPRIQAN